MTSATDPERVGRFGIQHSIQIQCSPGEIWQIILDFDNWENWNPLYVKTAGDLRVGEQISFEVALPGMQPQPGVASVLEVEPGRGVKYRIRSMLGLTSALRYIEIHEQQPGHYQVVNGEIMRGVLAPLLYWLFAGRIGRGLQAMNEALLAKIESAGESA